MSPLLSPPFAHGTFASLLCERPTFASLLEQEVGKILNQVKEVNWAHPNGKLNRITENPRLVAFARVRANRTRPNRPRVARTPL